MSRDFANCSRQVSFLIRIPPGHSGSAPMRSSFLAVGAFRWASRLPLRRGVRLARRATDEEMATGSSASEVSGEMNPEISEMKWVLFGGESPAVLASGSELLLKLARELGVKGEKIPWRGKVRAGNWRRSLFRSASKDSSKSSHPTQAGKAWAGDWFMILISEQGLKSRQQSFLEKCQAPVVILPETIVLDWPPIQSILVPISPSLGFCVSLTSALELGARLRVPVDVVHVFESVPHLSSGASPQHYLREVEDWLARLTPFSTSEERLCIRSFFAERGEVADCIRQLAREKRGCWILAEWKGNLKPGRAKHLRALLRGLQNPVLLLRERAGWDSIDRPSLAMHERET